MNRLKNYRTVRCRTIRVKFRIKYRVITLIVTLKDLCLFRILAKLIPSFRRNRSDKPLKHLCVWLLRRSLAKATAGVLMEQNLGLRKNHVKIRKTSLLICRIVPVVRHGERYVFFVRFVMIRLPRTICKKCRCFLMLRCRRTLLGLVKVRGLTLTRPRRKITYELLSTMFRRPVKLLVRTIIFTVLLRRWKVKVRRRRMTWCWLRVALIRRIRWTHLKVTNRARW